MENNKTENNKMDKNKVDKTKTENEEKNPPAPAVVKQVEPEFRLKTILKKRNKKAAWLVKATGLQKSMISRYVNGKVSNIHTNTLKKICKALNITSKDVLGF